MKPLLEAAGVSVHRGARPVLSSVNLSLVPGQLWTVLGPNGAGKSTLLKALAGLLPLSSGSVRVSDRPLSEWSRRALARELAWLPQTAEGALEFTALEYVLLGRSPHLAGWAMPSSADVALAQSRLEELGLSELSDRKLSRSSGGERRMLSVARALVQEAKVILLDEPTAFLDLRHQLQVLAQLRKAVAAGAGAVVILHDVNLAAAFADRVLLLKDGRELASGPPHDILTPERLETLYGVPMRAATAGSQRLFAPAG